MQDKEIQYGHATSTPYYIINEEGISIPIKFIEDAVSPQARVGVKAGNSLLDEINRELRIEQTIKEAELQEKLKDIE